MKNIIISILAVAMSLAFAGTTGAAVDMADNFDNYAAGPLTGQTSSNGQVWANPYDGSSWAVNLIVDESHRMGATGKGVGGNGLTNGMFGYALLPLNGTVTDGKVVVSADIRGGSAYYHQFGLVDSVNNKTLQIGYTAGIGTLWFDGIIATPNPYAGQFIGYAPGWVHITMTIDLDARHAVVDWSWSTESGSWTSETWGESITFNPNKVVLMSYAPAGSPSNGSYDNLQVSIPSGETATPVFTPDGGTYPEAQTVAITCATPGATIRYTTDGTEPTETNGTLIASGGLVEVDHELTLKAKAWAAGLSPSFVKSAQYFVTGVPSWVRKPGAVQTVYRNGVPHTDRNGTFRLTYDPEHSFFPIGNYWAWWGTRYNQTWTFADYVDLGLNCAMPGQVSEISEANDAWAAGIKLIYTEPNDAQVMALKDHPATLAYRMYDEPTGQYWFDDMEGHFQAFLTRKAEVKAMDPVHPFFTLDCGWILPPATEWFTAWNTAGDVSSHDNYPLQETTTSISHSQGIPETVSLAVSINNENKPLWFVAQAFGTMGNLKIPSADQERCMVYTSIIHGATGIIYFILDTYVSREASCIGLAPNPLPDYGHPSGVIADSNQLRASRALWYGVKALNSQLAQLRPAILSPTSSEPYEVYIDQTLPPITSDPIRTILKTSPDGGLTLLLTNIDAAVQKVKIRFPNKTFSAVELYGTLGFTRHDDYIVLDCPAWNSRIIRILDPAAISSAKTQPDQAAVACSGVVAAAFDDFFYVESTDRNHGIRVNETAHGRTTGQAVNVGGLIGTLASGERYINASDVSQTTGSGSIEPLAMSNKALGGGPSGLQAGVEGGVGPSNIGLLVSTSGKVETKGTGWFTIDDGSQVNVKVYGAVPSGNPHVVVTGASSCEKDGLGKIQRVIHATSVNVL